MKTSQGDEISDRIAIMYIHRRKKWSRHVKIHLKTEEKK